MRIIAGDLRGRTVVSPDASTTRPTTDRVREALFSSLYSRVGELEGLRVLDAFAGSGALGIEALSRGSARCSFFEKDASACKVLQANLRKLGLGPERACVHQADVLASPGSALAAEGPFSVVLLDPPYALPAADVCAFLTALAGAGCLAAGCVASYEHAVLKGSAAEELEARVSNTGQFVTSGTRAYGKIAITYLEYSGAQGG